MTTKEVADALGITPQRVQVLIRAGRLKATRVRYGAYEVTTDECEAFKQLERGHGKPFPKREDTNQ